MYKPFQMLWWTYFRRPRFKAGDIVYNRYSPDSPQEVLKEYIGPHVGWHDTSFRVTELWLTYSGDKVAVGYFWLRMLEKPAPDILAWYKEKLSIKSGS